MGEVFSSLSHSKPVVAMKETAAPVLLQCFSSGVIGVIAELLSQLIRSPKLRNSGWRSLDFRSILSYFVFGVLSAPISQQLFSLLEYLLRDTPEGFAKFFKKVVIERALFAPLFLFLYKLIIPVLKGQSLSDVIRELPQGFLRTLCINIVVWSPFSYINTNYVPIEKRVLAANLMGLLWTCFLSYQASK